MGIPHFPPQKAGLICISKQGVLASPFQPPGCWAQSAQNRLPASLGASLVRSGRLSPAPPDGQCAPGQGWPSLLVGAWRVLSRGGEAEQRQTWGGSGRVWGIGGGTG